MEYRKLKNNGTLPVRDIPDLDYKAFFELNTGLMAGHPERHCVTYHGIPSGEKIRLICCIADDATGDILVSSCLTGREQELEALTSRVTGFERYEREIRENFGIPFSNHPWLKPVRYPFDRADRTRTIANYPFYSMEGDELHEVGVGPIHAGVIEPGHFRFICNGEKVLHLEIQLGYQHRGVEALFLTRDRLMQRVVLAESIAGDTVAGHTTAFSGLWEALSGVTIEKDIAFSRTLALGLGRVAIHTGDLAALCTDIAYQLGSAVFGRLRTPLVNFMQEWCGNRLGKGLIRPGRNPYPFTEALATRLKLILDDYERGRLARIYHGVCEGSAALVPLPRRDLMNPRAYLLRHTLVTSRGCPHACDFCYKSSFWGPPADDVRAVTKDTATRVRIESSTA